MTFNIPYRTGLGYDVHRLVEGRELILCGCHVPHTHGLLGHSDADVALHALADAILGALAMRDIGYHFPDTDPQYAGADSRVLLRKVVAMAAEKSYMVANADITIVAQSPRLMPYIEEMRANVAADLRVPVGAVSVKATTTEHLGFEGRREGISAIANVLVCRGIPLIRDFNPCSKPEP